MIREELSIHRIFGVRVTKRLLANCTASPKNSVMAITRMRIYCKTLVGRMYPGI